MYKYVLFGGARGVGKTRIADELSQIVNLSMIKTGDLVQEYQKKHQGISLDEYIYNAITAQKKDLLVDTHYAAYKNNPYTFERGISKKCLDLLNKNTYLCLFLIMADIEQIYKRRLNDQDKKRIISLDQIAVEQEANIKFFKEYNKELSRDGYVIWNNSIKESVKEVIFYLSSYKNFGGIKCK